MILLINFSEMVNLEGICKFVKAEILLLLLIKINFCNMNLYISNALFDKYRPYLTYFDAFFLPLYCTTFYLKYYNST